MEVLLGKTRILALKADITTQDVDAIVNAANSALAGGGGVDGAIHRAAGPSVMAECRAMTGGCPTGAAVVSGAGDLLARRIIHAVGPVWYGGHKGERELLDSAYRASLRLALDEGLRSLAFPALSTGAYRYPLTEATSVAVSAVTSVVEAHPEAFEEIRFVCFSEKDLRAYDAELAKL